MINRFSASLSVFYMAHRGRVPQTASQPVTQSVKQIIAAHLGVELWPSEANYQPFPHGVEEEIREMVRSVRPLTVHTSTHTWAPGDLRGEILFAGSIGASLLVVHPNTFGIERCENPPGAIELRDICAFAREHGVTLALENSGRTGMATIRQGVDMVGSDPDATGLGVCIDTGHALRAVSKDGIVPFAYFEEFRDLIVEIHINDNEGVEDLHLAPGDGKLDWAGLLPVIRSLPRDPIVCLEITSPGDPVESLLAAKDYVIHGP